MQSPALLNDPQRRRELRQTRDRSSAEAQALACEGQLAAAIALVREVYRIDGELFGRRSLTTAETLAWLAELQRREHDFAAARQSWREVLQIRREILGETHWQAADARLELEWIGTLETLGPSPRERLDEADRLWRSARQLGTEGKAAEAIVLLDRGAKIYETLSLDGSRPCADVLFEAGRLAGEREEPAAEGYLRRSLALYERTLPENHPRQADAMTRLGDAILHTGGDPREARRLYERSLRIARDVHGEKSWEFAELSFRLGSLDGAPLPKAASMAHLRHALDTAVSLLAGRYGLSSGTCDWKGLHEERLKYGDAGNARRCELVIEAHRRLVSLVEEEAEHCRRSTDLAGLAAAQQSLAEVQATYYGAQATPAVAARVESLRAGRLAKLTADQRTRVADAERLATRADALIAEHELAAAREPAGAALKTQRELLGHDHPATLASLLRLARIYRLRSEYLLAEPLLLEALQGTESLYGSEHPDHLAARGELGRFYLDVGALERASLYLRGASDSAAERLDAAQQVAAVIEQAAARITRALPSGPELALRALRQGDAAADTMLDRLERERQQSWATAEEMLDAVAQRLGGPDLEEHPLWASWHYQRGRLHAARGELPQAVAELERGLVVGQRHLQHAFTFQPRSEQLTISRRMRAQLGAYLSAARAAQLPAQRVYTHVLAFKGAVFVHERRLRQARSREALPQLFAELSRADRELAAAVHGAGGEPSGGQEGNGVAEWVARRERLEHDVSVGLAAQQGAEHDTVSATLDDVRRVLPEDAVLVDLLEYPVEVPEWPAPVTSSQDIMRPRSPAVCEELVAFVMGRQGEVQRVDLGHAAVIEREIARWRRRFAWTGEEADGAAADAAGDPGQGLRRLLWEPLAGTLHGARRIIISPDGASGRLPWAALPGDQPGRFLVEQYEFSIVPVPQQLPERRQLAPPAEGATQLVLVGDVDFGSPPSDASPGRVYAALPGTVAEVEKVAELWRRAQQSTAVTVLSRGDATKDAVGRSAAGSRYLHLATHGFFQPVPPAARQQVEEQLSVEAQFQRMRRFAQRKPTQFIGPAGEVLEFSDWDADPLFAAARQQRWIQLMDQFPELMSGIVFAGANRTAAPAVLYAVEVADLPLDNAELVTLSACETGLGYLAGGEGVLGLSRAFHLAGARTVVASLWKVHDGATQLFMERFYDNLWSRRMRPGDALRETQLWMLREATQAEAEGKVRGLKRLPPAQPPENGRLPPYYWAAFALSGDGE